MPESAVNGAATLCRGESIRTLLSLPFSSGFVRPTEQHQKKPRFNEQPRAEARCEDDWNIKDKSPRTTSGGSRKGKANMESAHFRRRRKARRFLGR